jgi:hypothetical protein
MTFTLDRKRVSNLVEYVDRNVRTSGCDHSHRFSATWAAEHAVNWDDLLDALEGNGAFCDCEVVLNVEDGPLTCNAESSSVDRGNLWLLPPNFGAGPETTTAKVIVSRAGVGRNTHTKDGEWLVPAPADVKPRKRVRKLVHFFIGAETGLPSEVGVVRDVEPMSIARFAHTIACSSIPDLRDFDPRVASFVLGKIAALPDGTPVGTDIVDRVGVSSRHRELTVHRVILRR